MELRATSCAPARRKGVYKQKALLAGFVAMLALATAACGNSEPAASAAAPPAEISQEELTALPESTTTSEIPDAPLDPQPNAATEGEVLHPKQQVVVYREANGKPFAKLPPEQLGSPTWVPVIAKQGEWAQILLPSRPNASTGWIHVTGDKVESARNDYVVNVDVQNFKLELKQNGNSVGSWTIGVGKPAHPTPKGRAYIIASIEEQVNTYSPYVLPLSYHSDSLETYGGGTGTVGIHTWPDNSFVGKADSDGCIRVTKEALNRLIEVPLGTIIQIT